MNSFPSDNHEAVVTVTDVASRQISKRDGTTMMMFDIATAEHPEPFTTTKRMLAESAFDLKGRQAKISYNVKTNGNFTNYWLNQIVPVAGNPAERAMQAQQGGQVLTQAVGIPTNDPSTLQPSQIPSRDEERQEAIHRQTAAKVAAVLYDAESNPADFWHNVRMLSHYFDTGQMPQSVVEQGLVTSQVSSDQDDDIPF